MDCMILVQALIAFIVLGRNVLPLISLVVAASVRALLRLCLVFR